VSVSIDLRILQHVVISYLERYYEENNSNFKNSFIEETYACRKGLGSHKAVFDLKEKISLNEEKLYYLQLDIESFFNTINKNKLYSILENDFRNIKFTNKKLVFYYLKLIIFHNYQKKLLLKSSKEKFDLIPKHKSFIQSNNLKIGLPIGNLTSQFFANVYLNKFDKYIKNMTDMENKKLFYLRYMDDFIILNKNKFFLLRLLVKIDYFLKEELFLKLHENKIIIKKIEKGLDFLGYIIKDNYILVRKKIIKNLNRRIRIYNHNFKKYGVKKEYLEKYLQILNSYFAHFNLSNSYKLKNKIFNKKLKEHFILVENKVSKNIFMNLKKEKLSSIYIKNKKLHKDYLIGIREGMYYYYLRKDISKILEYFNYKIEYFKEENKKVIKIHIKNKKFFENLIYKKIPFLLV
jgi:hypothetical protein